MVEPRRWIYFTSASGAPVVEQEMDDIADLSPQHEKLVAKLNVVMENYRGGKQGPKGVKGLGDKLFELRAKISSNVARLIFTQEPGGILLALQAVYKKTDGMETTVAKRRHTEWLGRQ